MFISDELRGWIEDKGRQRHSNAATDRFRRAWNEGPVHRALGQAMADLAGRTPEAIAAQLEDWLHSDGWIDRLISETSAELRQDPFFDPAFRYLNSDIHKGLVVYEDESVSIAIGVMTAGQLAARKNRNRGKTSVGFTGQLGVVKFVKAGNALISFWESPPITAGFTATNAGSCRRTGQRRLRDGEILIIDGRRQSFVIEHAKSNLLMVQAAVKSGLAPVSVEYDSATGEYVGCSAADDSASRIQMITTLLRRLDCEAAVPVMAQFLDNPNFFVRWHVMRELLALDAEAALPHLKRMAARDPHPETRRVAGQVLDSIEAARPARRKAA